MLANDDLKLVEPTLALLGMLEETENDQDVSKIEEVLRSFVSEGEGGCWKCERA